MLVSFNCMQFAFFLFCIYIENAISRIFPCANTREVRKPAVRNAGAPRAEREPGASSNITHFQFCELQNRRRKCRIFVRIMMWSPKKKSLHRNSNGFFRSKLGGLQKKGWSLHCHLIFSLVFWNQNSWKPKCNACHRLRYLKFFKTNQNSHRCNSTKYSILRINYTSQRVTSRKTTTDVVWVTSSTLPQRRLNAGLRGYRKSYACTQSLMFRSEK